MSDTVRLVAGAMSGTSADGVDVAIVRISGRGIGMDCRLLHHHHRRYDPLLKDTIVAVRSRGAADLGEFAKVGREISLAYSAAVNEALLGAHLHAGDLAAVAAHGQTFFHEPPLSIQWLDPALIACEVGCPVISDFRRADCAAGGQGAPLVPFADYILFRHPQRSRVLLNIGGIANCTCLPAGGTLEQVVAFDTGPGNCLSDYLMRQHGGENDFDLGGKLALRGKPNSSVIYTMLHRTWFLHDPPKATDTPSMIHLWEDTLRQMLGPDATLPLEDALATACLLTARAVAHAIRDFAPTAPDEVLVSGGGTNNAAIMQFLQQELKPIPLTTTNERGVDSAAKEALAFALLGAATLDNLPANVPHATGAYRPVVLGSITPKP